MYLEKCKIVLLLGQFYSLNGQILKKYTTVWSHYMQWTILILFDVDVGMQLSNVIVKRIVCMELIHGWDSN